MDGSWKKSLVSFLFLASLAWSECSADPVGAAIWTNSGLIQGHAAPNRTTVSEYLGIPYGQAPVGDLRFAPPVHFQSHATYNASAYVSLQNPGRK
jgi:hypothetical protein